MPPVPKATEELSVPLKISELETVKVLPFAMVKIPVELVMVKPLMLVAVATPKMGVTNVGLVANTAAPLPVSSEREVASWLEVIEPEAVPYRVPDVGRVTFVLPVWVKVRGKLPEVVKLLAVVMLPPSVMVLAPLSMPVPPLAPDKIPETSAVSETAE